MGRHNRRDERLRVNLSVRYESAREFIVEYTENISSGGLFIRSAHHLEVGEEVRIEIQLPGFKKFKVFALVIHILPPEEAAILNRKPGAGFRITKVPKDFKEALRSYLLLLGRRRDYIVFVRNESFAKIFEEAGYNSRIAPPPENLLSALFKLSKPVIAVIVPRKQVKKYSKYISLLDTPELLKTIDLKEELDSLFYDLDQAIM